MQAIDQFYPVNDMIQNKVRPSYFPYRNNSNNNNQKLYMMNRNFKIKQTWNKLLMTPFGLLILRDDIILFICTKVL